MDGDICIIKFSLQLHGCLTPVGEGNYTGQRTKVLKMNEKLWLESGGQN